MAPAPTRYPEASGNSEANGAFFYFSLTVARSHFSACRWDFLGFFGCPTVFFTASSGVLRRFLQFLGAVAAFFAGWGLQGFRVPWLAGGGCPGPWAGYGLAWLGTRRLEGPGLFWRRGCGYLGAGLFVPWLELEIRDEYLLMAEPLTF